MNVVSGGRLKTISPSSTNGALSGLACSRQRVDTLCQVTVKVSGKPTRKLATIEAERRLQRGQVMSACGNLADVALELKSAFWRVCVLKVLPRAGLSRRGLDDADAPETMEKRGPGCPA